MRWQRSFSMENSVLYVGWSKIQGKASSLLSEQRHTKIFFSRKTKSFQRSNFGSVLWTFKPQTKNLQMQRQYMHAYQLSPEPRKWLRNMLGWAICRCILGYNFLTKHSHSRNTANKSQTFHYFQSRSSKMHEKIKKMSIFWLNLPWNILKTGQLFGL